MLRTIAFICSVALACATASAQSAKKPPKFTKQQIARGADLYARNCSSCHGADGKGETAVGKANKLRDLGSPDVQKQSDTDVTGVITNGKNKMPAYGKRLKPEQIKDLVA